MTNNEKAHTEHTNHKKAVQALLKEEGTSTKLIEVLDPYFKSDNWDEDELLIFIHQMSFFRKPLNLFKERYFNSISRKKLKYIYNCWKDNDSGAKDTLGQWILELKLEEEKKQATKA